VQPASTRKRKTFSQSQKGCAFPLPLPSLALLLCLLGAILVFDVFLCNFPSKNLFPAQFQTKNGSQKKKNTKETKQKRQTIKLLCSLSLSLFFIIVFLLF
jgi:hypothetical protein